MKELKPCPFCGSKWTQVRYINNPFDKNHVYAAIVQSAQIATLSQRLLIMNKMQLRHGTGEQGNE